MSQEKAQLIAPQGHFTVPGLNVAGVVTASSFSGNCTGTASSIVKGTNVVVGVMTASSFVGDVTGNVTGIGSNTDNLHVGVVTATSFAGNFTGIGSGLTGTPNVVAGVVTATKFVGNTPGTVSKLSDGTNINVGVITATKFVGNTPGLAAGISAAQNINVGVLTATGGLYGDGSGLTGAGTTGFIKQDVTAVSGTTTINLNNGNIIYLTHSNNTTIAFSNVSTATDVTIIRTLTDNTITWPAAITWNGGSAPTLLGSNSYSLSGQVFNLVTADGGTTWYGYEEVNNDNPQPYKIFSLGRNNVGQLGHSNTTDYSSPTQISSGENWVKLGGTGMTDGQAISTGVKSDGTLWTWGQNNNGALGHNNHTDFSSPRQVGTDTDWSFSEVGCAAVKTDGTLWMWGQNNYGQLGQNNTTRYSSPVQIPGTTWSTDPKSLTIGGAFAAAIKTDGTLWAWGYNNTGRLGLNQGPGNNFSSPTQVGTDTTWDSIDAGSATCFATKTDGTLWSWGSGSGDGDLGHNDKSNYSSPKQIPGTTWANGYQKVSAHGQGGAAIRTDGTLWTWGNNGNGELGLNNKTEYSSPKQVPGTTWRTVQGAQDAMFATKTDGTLWAWGDNTYGSLGQNDRTNESSPKQIPGTDWQQLIGANSGGGRSFFATKVP